MAGNQGIKKRRKMGRPYDLDLRKKAIKLVEKGKSKEEIAVLLDIGLSTLYRWMR